MVNKISLPRLKETTEARPRRERVTTIPPTRAAQVLKPASKPNKKKAGVVEVTPTLNDEKMSVFWRK